MRSMTMQGYLLKPRLLH